jgi:fluoroacetyl-CoA thioesterase
MSDQDLPPLQVGLRHTETMTVDAKHVVPALAASWPDLAGMPPAFATAMMISFIEYTCIQGLRPYLTEAQRTLGTHVDVSHLAATPIGMTVTATVELTEIDGRALAFTVRCEDEAGPIGEGTHKRAIVDGERFTARLNAKAGNA